MAHHLIIGATGTGKSTLLADIALGVEGGLIVLDPNETFALRVADNFPDRDGSTNDCIYFDPTDTLIPLNILYDVPEGRQRHRVASNMVATLKARWDDSWGPRLEWILYNSIRLAIDNNLTLLHVSQILTNKPFRKQQLRNASY
jgi:DNA helicase HerA-like ATPase